MKQLKAKSFFALSLSKGKLKVKILFIFLVISSFNVSASVVLNEVAIQPNQIVELYNNASESADISSWYIDDAGGTTYFTIPSQTILPPQSCLIFNGDFNFNKSSADVVRLFDNSNPPTTSSARLIESYSYLKAPDTNYSFSKIIDGGVEWQTASSSLGLSNISLSSCIPTPTPTPSPTETPIPTPTPTNSPTPTFPTSTPYPPQPTTYNLVDYQNIYISEVYPYPNPDEDEWIELYNDNDTQVNLTHWYIDDGENTGSAPKSFSLIIEPYSYAAVDISSSLFNNSGDVTRLLNTNKIEKDSMEYGKISQEKSIARISFSEDLYCEQEPSKNAANSSCISEPTLPLPTQKTQSAVKPTQKTPIPTKKMSIQTQTQFKTNSYNSPALAAPLPTPEGEVLGIEIQTTQPPSPTPYLSFVSGSYSLLTIVSVFIKMKNA